MSGTYLAHHELKSSLIYEFTNTIIFFGVFINIIIIGVQGRETVVLPRRPDARSPADKVKLSIQRQLEFSSQTLRSGVVVVSTDAPQGSALLYLRGAPAVIKSLVTPTSVPPDFDQVHIFPQQKRVFAVPKRVSTVPRLISTVPRHVSTVPRHVSTVLRHVSTCVQEMFDTI